MDLNIGDLYQKKTDEQLVNEANRVPTVPTGAYTIQISHVQAQKGENPQFPPLFDREFAHVRASVEKDGQKVGAVWFDLSWDTRRKDDGTLDTYSKLWGNAVKALDLHEASIGEVLDALKQFPLTAYITERFKIDEEYKSARNEKERAELLVAGAEPRNYVLSLSKVK